MDIERQVTAVLRAKLSAEPEATHLQIMEVRRPPGAPPPDGVTPENITACTVHDADGRFSLSIDRDDDGLFRVTSAIHLGKSATIEVAPDADLHRLVGRAALSLQFGASS